MAEFVLTPQVKAQALKSMGELRGETVFIVSKQTSKPIRVGPGGNVTANGGLGPNARFKVRRGDRPHKFGPVVRFQNFATGHWLAIKNGQLTTGSGGDHCEFIVERKQAAVLLRKHHNPKARIGFNPNGQPVPANTLGEGDRARFFIFDCDQVAPANAPTTAQQRVAAQQAKTAARIAEQQARTAAKVAQQQQRVAQHQQQVAARQQAHQQQMAARQQAHQQQVAARQHAHQQQVAARQRAHQQQVAARQQAAARQQVNRVVQNAVAATTAAVATAATAHAATAHAVAQPVAQPVVAQAVPAAAVPAVVAQPATQIIEYRTNPDADGNGNTWFLDRHHVKVGPGQVLTGFHLTRPTNKTIQYQFWASPTSRLGPEMATNTQSNAAGGGKVIFLDRHTVMAPGMGLLTGFKLQRTVPTQYHIQFTFNPTAGVGPVLEQATAPQEGKNAIYLDRQTVRAPVGYGLKGFQLFRPTGNTVAYKYWVQKIA